MQKHECINTFDRLLKWPDATLVGDTLAVHDKTRQGDNFKVEFDEAGNKPASRVADEPLDGCDIRGQACSALLEWTCYRKSCNNE